MISIFKWPILFAIHGIGLHFQQSVNSYFRLDTMPSLRCLIMVLQLNIFEIAVSSAYENSKTAQNGILLYDQSRPNEPIPLLSWTWPWELRNYSDELR